MAGSVPVGSNGAKLGAHRSKPSRRTVKAAPRRPSVSVRIVLLGAPGSGKGTLAEFFSQRLGVPHLSTGELFRREIAKQSALGRRVQRYVAQGALVPDELVVKVMTAHLPVGRLRQGFALDGFPRTVGQAEGLAAYTRRKGYALDAAISLECSRAALIERLSGRLVCSRCAVNYHVRRMPPKRPGVCDRCGGTLIVRQDDQVDTIKKRLRIDHDKAKPLLAYYRWQQLLISLDGHGSGEQVYQRALRLFKRRGWLNPSAFKAPQRRVRLVVR